MPESTRKNVTRDPLRVLVAGGGVAAAEFVIALRQLVGDEVELTLLSPQDRLTYRPLSVAAPFANGNGTRSYSLDRLAADFGAYRRPDTLSWVAPSAHTAFTGAGDALGYDVLVVATGARREPAFEHALTFRGYEDSAELRAPVEQAERERGSRIAFVASPGCGWTLPVYELALMTAHRAPRAELTLITPEERPLELFGSAASDDVAALLAAAAIRFEPGADPDVPEPGRVVVGAGRDDVVCDHVIALPRLRGPAIRGLPCDDDGFLPTTSFGHVIGVRDVYAAGDGTTFPIKQGGVACQQADVVAQVIARRAGADVTPSGYRPTLRGVLLTGDRSRWLRHAAPRHGQEASEAAGHSLWWPPSKVAGRFLAPYLGEAVAQAASPGTGRAVITTGRDGGHVELVTLDRAPNRARSDGPTPRPRVAG
jgi:sulfide:quinone oxidoreductase